ncbi:MAG: type II toxin-antitoxin system ParD family antitoxin [Ghiorsea sp.]|nr:type II toxin-antitoxin system ParD family antitoxin [Ghiorsea sp.]MDQ7058384.1 type II toxin-antitoxin system ParD family antitoxin [Ghiorsea sp.]
MHISLTPKLESKIKSKVSSGLYNNASEVVREALRFMEENEEIVQQMKLNHLRQAIDTGAQQVENGQLSTRQVDDIIADLNNAE